MALLNNQMVYHINTPHNGESHPQFPSPMERADSFSKRASTSLDAGVSPKRRCHQPMGECSTMFNAIFMVTDSATHQTSLIFDTWSKVRKCWVDISPHFTTISELRCHQLVFSTLVAPCSRTLQEKSDRWGGGTGSAEALGMTSFCWPLLIVSCREG